MNIIETAIPGLLIIEPRIFCDERGFFLESWSATEFAKAGLDLTFVQDNHSRSVKGVLRGLHFQTRSPQGKLVRVVSGAVYDVAVDIRRSSPHFGKWAGVTLSATNKRMVWVPPGFAHGFVALEDGTDILYKCTARYDPASEHTILWNDPEIAIEWPDVGNVQLSAKDLAGKLLSESETFA